MRRRLAAWALAAPAALTMLLVIAYPLAHAAWLSLQRFDLRFPDQRGFVGLANYRAVLASPLWWQDLTTTLGLTAATVALELALGFLLALVMHRARAARALIRAAVLVPYALVTVVAAFAWRFAFDPAAGFAARALGGDHAWLASRGTALVVIVLVEVWKTSPFVALLLLAGLAGVPADVEKAASLDGAGAWRRMRRITLPMMLPAIVIALLFRTLDAFRIFDSVFVLTRGAAGTETVSLLAYVQMLNRLNLGIGAAVALLVSACALALALAIVAAFRRHLVAGASR